MGAPVEFLSRRERARRFGFDCPSLVYYRDWVPGGEYQQQIVLKNTGKKLQSIKYKLPDSKYFSMRFPDPIRLASGNSTTVEVTFRPVIYEPYDDYIEFECPGGTFFIRVVATVKQLAVALAECVDYNFVAVNELAVREVEIHNIGELDAKFEWRLTGPFELSPMRGMIPAGESEIVTISFHPTDASVFVARAMLDATSGNHTMTKEFRMSGIAKFPHLVTSEPDMDFEEVLNGLVKHKTFFLKNDSLVPAVFSVTPVESDMDHVFSYSQTEGIIPPEEDLQLRVTYKPSSSGSFSTSRFDLATAGGNVLRMKLTGSCVGPAVTLSHRSINFGDVHLGDKQVDGHREPPTHKRSFQIINGSDVTIDYSFDASAEGMFGFSQTMGSIKAHSYHNVIVSFTPRYDAVNFYKRVTCLVRDQGALTIDLLATAVDPQDKRRPAQLKLKHVHQYHRFLEYGISRCPPDVQELAVAEINQTGMVPRGIKGATARGEALVIFNEPSYHESLHGFFVAGNDPRRDVQLDTSAIDFEYQLPNAAIGGKTVWVTNKSGHKIICFWQKPPEREGMPAAFEIYPIEKDILAGQSESFQVNFNPTVSNEYFAEMLECVTFPKTTRTFRLVNQDTYCAPISMMLNAMGHSISPGTEHFIPKCAFSQERINMPGTLIGGSSFQTIRITNSATTPLQYDFEDEGRSWSVKPRVGTIRPKEFCLVTFRFNPKVERRYEHKQAVTLNFGQKETLTLIGTGYHPQVHFGDDTEGLYLTPTCVGAISQKTSRLVNTSRIAVHYKFHIPDRLQRVMVIDRPEGIIDGNNEQQLTWTFAPQKAKLYMEQLELDLLPSETSVTGETQTMAAPHVVKLDVIGDGTASGISFASDHCDFGAVLVNNSCTQELWLINKSICNVTYKLTFKQTLKLSEDAEPAAGDLQHDNPPLSYDLPTGVIEARSRKKIMATFAPTLRRFYNFVTYCHAVPDPVPEIGDVHFEPPEPSMDREAGPLLCLLEMDGVSTYPAIAFADVRVMGFDAVQLWKQLNLDSINDALAVEPGAFESQLNIAEGLVGGGGYTGIIDRLDVFDMHIPPAARKTPAITIMFKLENQGHLPVEWSITFPTEKQVEVELWAEAEEPGERELRWSDIVAKKLFAVEPRRGALQPGENQLLMIKYNYTYIDNPWELPVILQAKKGRRMVLNLIGTTLKPQAQLLWFGNKPFDQATHVLQPVPIGEVTGPVQTIELFNPGSCGAEYEIDTAPLRQMTNDNYSFEVLKIENPIGPISACGRTKIRIIFCPLEAKLYQVKLRVTIIGTNTSWWLTVQATGFHPQMIVNELQFRHAASTFPRLPGFHQPWMPTLGSKTDCLRLKEQVAVMTPDIVSFGWTPLHTKQHRLVTITNISEDNLTFDWDENDVLLGGGAFTIAPLRGLLGPGESVMSKVTYHPVLRPELVEASIVVVVRPEEIPEPASDDLDDNAGGGGGGDAASMSQKSMARTSMVSKHGGDAEEYPTLMERQQHATTVDHIPSHHDRNLPPGFADDLPAAPAKAAGGRRGSNASRAMKSRRGSVASEAYTMAGSSTFGAGVPENDTYWNMYLNIEALAVEQETYRKLHSKYECSLVTRDTDVYSSCDVPDVPENGPQAMEEDLITMTMCDLMKHVARDLDVGHAFETVEKKPMPYFSQFSTAALTPAAMRSAIALQTVESRSGEQAAASGAPVGDTQAVAAAAELDEVGNASNTTGEQPVAEAALEQTVAVDAGSMAEDSKETLALVKAGMVHARNQKLAKKQAEEQTLQELYREDKFFYSVADIMENTMSNLVYEASFGEFEITKAPRVIASVVD